MRVGLLRGLSLTSIAVCVALGLASCASPEDSNYRAAVPQVLKAAATLEERVSRARRNPAWADEDSVIEAYRRAVESLPAPSRKEFRYLSMRLKYLADATQDASGANAGYRLALETNAQSRQLGVAEDEEMEREFLEMASAAGIHVTDAFQMAAVAERISLGSSTLWDRQEALMLSTPRDSLNDTQAEILVAGRDSVYRSKEILVRRELARMR